MFSVRQKREIAEAVQKLLRATNHRELPDGEIQFSLHVDGAKSWSWADIRNNGAVTTPSVNPHNEAQDDSKTGKRHVVDKTKYLPNAITFAQDGDTIECRTETMRELAERAHARMCPDKRLAFEVTKT